MAQLPEPVFSLLERLVDLVDERHQFAGTRHPQQMATIFHLINYFPNSSLPA